MRPIILASVLVFMVVFMANFGDEPQLGQPRDVNTMELYINGNQHVVVEMYHECGRTSGSMLARLKRDLRHSNNAALTINSFAQQWNEQPHKPCNLLNIVVYYDNGNVDSGFPLSM